MADYNSSLPVRTQNDGDVVVKLGDGTTPSQYVSVDASGRLTIKLDDGSGNPITSQTNGAQRALDVGINVAGVQIDPRQIRALTAADIVTAQQGTSPWITKDQNDGPVTPGTVASFSGLIGGQFNTVLPTLTNGQQAAVQVDSSGRLLVAGALTLTYDTNYGTVGATTLRTAAQIGNATGAANFGAGATGAQTLRVEANQGASATAANGWFVRPTDGTNSQVYLATGEAKVSVTQPLPAGTNNIGKVSIQDSSGAAISPTNPLPVTIDTVLGTPIDSFNTATSIASGASSNADYTVTAAKTFYSDQVIATGSGKLKVQVQYETGVATGVFNTFFVGFNSTATPNVYIPIPSGKTQIAGARIRVIRTNLDLLAQDVYSTLSGNEI